MIYHLFWWILRRANRVSKNLIPNKNDKSFFIGGIETRASRLYGTRNEKK
jgi:hypothetical protein